MVLINPPGDPSICPPPPLNHYHFRSLSAFFAFHSCSVFSMPFLFSVPSLCPCSYDRLLFSVSSLVLFSVLCSFSLPLFSALILCLCHLLHLCSCSLHLFLLSASVHTLCICSCSLHLFLLLFSALVPAPVRCLLLLFSLLLLLLLCVIWAYTIIFSAPVGYLI